MKKTTLGWIILILVCVFLSGCTSHYTDSPIINSTNPDTSSVNSSSDPTESDTNSSIANTSDFNDSRYEGVYPGSYTFSTNVESANRYMKIEKLNIPEKFMSYQVSLHGLITKDTLLIQLFTNSYDNSGELGFLNLKNNQYERLFEVKQEQCISILDWDSSRLVVQIGDANWIDVSLYYIDYQDKALHFVHQYSPETCQTGVIHNTVLLQENNIYFGTVNSEKSDAIIELYRYDILTGETSNMVSEAQNPIEYNGKVISVRKNATGEYRVWKDLNGNIEFNTNERLREIQSESQNLYSINNKFTDDIKKYTVFNIYDIANSQEILSTPNALDALAVNSYFVTWRNYSMEKPSLYWIPQNKILVFADIEEGENEFYINENSGLLVNYTMVNGKYAATYYCFELNV